jgi:Ca-activated chloride channel homolog
LTFDHPLRLVLLLLLAVGAALFLRLAMRARASQALAYSNLDFVVSTFGARRRPDRWLFWGIVAGLLAGATALAGPHVVIPVPVPDAGVVICIDTSGSMASTDVAPSRFEAAKLAARAFIDRTQPGTRIGIIAFATSAQAVHGLSTDQTDLKTSLDSLPAPDGATAIGDALELAAKMLPRRGHRAVVLVTDGVSNRGTNPSDAAAHLATLGVPIYAVGIGTPNGDIIPGTGQPATIDEDALRSYASATHGAFALAADAAQLRDTLARLGRSTTFERKSIDASLGFALSGAVLLIATLLGGFAAGRFP